MPSASRSARARWTVACGSPRMSASSAESTNGVRLRASSSCRSDSTIPQALAKEGRRAQPSSVSGYVRCRQALDGPRQTSVTGRAGSRSLGAAGRPPAASPLRYLGRQVEADCHSRLQFGSLFRMAIAGLPLSAGWDGMLPFPDSGGVRPLHILQAVEVGVGPEVNTTQLLSLRRP